MKIIDEIRVLPKSRFTNIFAQEVPKWVNNFVILSLKSDKYASSPAGSAAISGSLTAVVVFVPQWWGEGRGVGSRLVPPFAATPANGALPPAAHGPRLRGTPPPPPLWRPPPLGRLFLAAVVFATRPANYRNCKHLLCFLCTFRRLLQTCSAHWANFLYLKSFMTGKKMSIASKLIRG